ncbi:MAG TPA: FAD-dependent oxidoreductase [Acidimicrobiales bacterium]|nr:FAD-dependent oxidoreductase [Acidimicrobiales bacterium]
MSPLRDSDHVVIVGAGLSGWRVAEALRGEGYEGAVSLIGDELDAPYDRPPLSKQVLAGQWGIDQTRLATDERVAAADVTLHLGVAARSLDVATTTVHLEDGSSIAGTHVVLATGARARRLPFSADSHLHVLRTRRDALALIGAVDRLEPGRVVAIIGGGFVGAEVATSLHTRGLRPVVFEVAAAPLVGPLGATVANWLKNLPAEAGIELRCGVHVTDVTEVAGEFLVHVEGEGPLAAAVVVVGAGAIPNVEWLATSGLTIDNGVVVDRHFLATERVAAVGDVARFSWDGPLGEQLVRMEHWEVAAGHALALARHWVHGESPGPMVPYFWSDQYGRKIQMVGHPAPSDDVTRVAERDDGAKWLAIYSHDGVVTGAVGLNMPRQLTLSRHLLESTTSLEAALSSAPWET